MDLDQQRFHGQSDGSNWYNWAAAAKDSLRTAVTIQGANVSAFARNPEKLSAAGITGVRYIAGDLNDSVAWKN
ncbi:hypothetical protein HDU93_006896, partial [Gonapodya sp. JEL0774]